jgi:predicted porin
LAPACSTSITHGFGRQGQRTRRRADLRQRRPDSSAQQYEISYTYPLSKRTSIYTGYNRVDNDANAAYNFGVNSYPIAIGGKPQGFVIGGWHNF